MIVSLEIILMLLTLISLKINFFKKNFYFIFNIFWLLCLLISQSNYFELYQISEKTYEIILLGIISFNLSMFMPLKKIKNLKIEEIREVKKKWIIIFVIFYFFINIFLIFRISKNIDFINKYYLVRFFYYGIDGEYLFKYSILQIIYEVFQSFNECILLYGIYMILENKIKKYFYYSFFNFLLFTFISGSRELLFYLILIFILCIKIRSFKLFLKEIIFIILVVFIISLNRGSSSLKAMIELLILYFTGSINFMDYHLREIDLKQYYGKLFFSSIITPIEFILKKINFIKDITIYKVGGELARTVNISQTQTYNALPTMFYIFYKDMRMVGVIFYSLLLGIFYKVIYFSNKINNATLVLFSYLETILIYSILVYKFNKFIHIVPILFFYIIMKKRKQNER